MYERLRCLWCNDVIGVYEPIVVDADGEARQSGLLREDWEEVAESCYHRDCFCSMTGREQLPQR
jgi:hypothetical protein